ncbi:MAG: 50S ribosomal protein L14e [Candidatus Woesearchaeota archaeon]
MFDIGRVCVKIAGRDATLHAVVIDTIDARHVLIDGYTRRRKVNTAHLEPLKQTVVIAKQADTQTVVKALTDLGIKGPQKGEKREAKPRPKKTKVKHA